MATSFDCRIVLDKAVGVTLEIEEIGDASTKQVVTISMTTGSVEIVHGDRTDDEFQPHSRMSLGADGHVVVDCKKFTVKADTIELLASDDRDTFAEDGEVLPMGSIRMDKESYKVCTASTEDKLSSISLDDAKTSITTTESADKTTVINLSSSRVEATAKGDGTVGLKAGDETTLELDTASATAHGKEKANLEAGSDTSIALQSSSAVHKVGSSAILELKSTSGDLAGDLTVEKTITGGGGGFKVASSGNVSAPKVEAG